jgi:hypothetical protein
MIGNQTRHEVAEAHKLAASFIADPQQYMDVCKHPEHLVMVSRKFPRPRITMLIRDIAERRDDHEGGHVGAALGTFDGVFQSQSTGLVPIAGLQSGRTSYRIADGARS